jgi:hypothetical protein
LLVYMSISSSYSYFLLKSTWYCMQSSVTYCMYLINFTIGMFEPILNPWIAGSMDADSNLLYEAVIL